MVNVTQVTVLRAPGNITSAVSTSIKNNSADLNFLLKAPGYLPY